MPRELHKVNEHSACRLKVQSEAAHDKRNEREDCKDQVSPETKVAQPKNHLLSQQVDCKLYARVSPQWKQDLDHLHCGFEVEDSSSKLPPPDYWQQKDEASNEQSLQSGLRIRENLRH